MKNNTLQKIILGILTLTVVQTMVLSSAKAEECSNSYDYSCCEVLATQGDGIGSLDQKITMLNANMNCQSRIVFRSPGIVRANDTYNIRSDVNGTNTPLVIGNSYDSQNSSVQNSTLISLEELSNDKPLFNITRNNVTIQNINVITAVNNSADRENFGRGSLIKCNGAQDVTIKNVYINNVPVNPNQITNCANFKFNGAILATAGKFLEASGSTGLQFEPTRVENINAPLLAVKNSNNYKIAGFTAQHCSAVGDDTTADDSQEETETNTNDGNISSADLYCLNNPSVAKNTNDTAIVIENSNGQISDVTLKNVPHNGLLIKTVPGSSSKISDLQMQGLDSINNGVGFTLQDVNGLKVESGNLLVTLFGQNGVVLAGSSTNNTISGASIFQNGFAVTVGGSNKGHGIVFSDEAQGNILVGSGITRNKYCGIFFDSTRLNQVSGNKISLNDQCGAFASDRSIVKVLTSQEIVMIVAGKGSFYLDVNLGAIPSVADANFVEMHQLLVQTTDAADFFETNQLDDHQNAHETQREVMGIKNTPFQNRSRLGSILGNMTVFNNGTAQFDQASFDSGVTFGENLNDTSKGDAQSLISSPDGSDFLVAKMPYFDVQNEIGARYFAFVRNASNQVVAIWRGVANDNPGDYVATEKCPAGCYTNPDADADEIGLQCRRIWRVSAEGTIDPLADRDGDGLDDVLEDINLNCKPDEGEMIVGEKDTDHDNLYDGFEVNISHTNPLLWDTDGDNVSDGDGWADGDKVNERCPLIPGNENCYYAYCIPVDSEIVNAAISEGNAAVDGQTDGYCDDMDGDHICSQVEDRNGNCEYDPGEETNAADPDTDNDGILDGNEDRNWNGIKDDNESDPLNPDTDGDGIPDGLEDKSGTGAPYAVNADGKETSPLLRDSDGDGLDDNVEDLNKNGKVDPGETSPFLADTDGDGKNDAEDLCPWSINPSCVVRYCGMSGINGIDEYDTDNDGLPDKKEDTDGNCAWTQSERESNPLDPDTDDDGLLDGTEVNCFGTNPIAADTDGDGRSDYDEVKNSINQCKPLYNLGDSNPLRAEFGGCSLNQANDNPSQSIGFGFVLTAMGLLIVMIRSRVLGKKS